VALISVGVRGNVENLGLEKLGVAVEKGYIKVDQGGRTNVAGVYAIGDVIGPPWLAHVASAEGSIASRPSQEKTLLPSTIRRSPAVRIVSRSSRASD